MVHLEGVYRTIRQRYYIGHPAEVEAYSSRICCSTSYRSACFACLSMQGSVSGLGMGTELDSI